MAIWADFSEIPGDAKRARLGNAAERGTVDPELVQTRAYLLASTTMGIFLTVRIIRPTRPI